MTRILLMVNLALPFITGYQFVMPSTLIIPPPDSSNSSFDQCNLIGGVYQCSYHSLFDCDPTINHFYYWNTNDFNNLQTTTVEFQIPVRMINIIIFVPLSTTRTILRIKISSVQDNNLVQVPWIHIHDKGVRRNFEKRFPLQLNDCYIRVVYIA